MRRSIFVGVVVACLVIVGTAVALAQQPSQASGQPMDGLRSPTRCHVGNFVGEDGWAQSHDEMHSWMTDNWDEMPMYGGVAGEDGWAQSHADMHSWMTDNWDEMPMYGGVAGEDGWAQSHADMHSWMTDNWDEMPCPVEAPASGWRRTR